MVQWLRICLPRQRRWVRSLVRELGSHMLQGNWAHEPEGNIPHAATKTLRSQRQINRVRLPETQWTVIEVGSHPWSASEPRTLFYPTCIWPLHSPPLRHRGTPCMLWVYADEQLLRWKGHQFRSQKTGFLSQHNPSPAGGSSARSSRAAPSGMLPL